MEYNAAKQGMRSSYVVIWKYLQGILLSGKKAKYRMAASGKGSWLGEGQAWKNDFSLYILSHLKIFVLSERSPKKNK